MAGVYHIGSSGYKPFIELAKKFLWIFHKKMGKFKRTFWPTQYIIIGSSTGQHWSRSDSDREESRTCGWAGLRTASHIRSVGHQGPGDFERETA